MLPHRVIDYSKHNQITDVVDRIRLDYGDSRMMCSVLCVRCVRCVRCGRTANRTLKKSGTGFDWHKMRYEAWTSGRAGCVHRVTSSSTIRKRLAQ